MSLSTTASPIYGQAVAQSSSVVKSRIASIDIMRGLVMIFMLMDHVRETIYLHMQVSDPMDVDGTSPDLFFTRLTAHICAPVFVFLTGLSAWLYSNPADREPRSPSSFLFKRGLFLVFLELTFVTFAWAFTYTTIWLQVIWAIGLSMIALSVLVRLPYWAVAAIGFTIVFGHNLLTPITFAPGEFGYSLWTILHDRNVLIEGGPIQVKISYPVLPWIGVILLGYVAGPLYARTVDSQYRRKILIALGAGCLALLAVLRGFNIYGETLDWVAGDTAVQTIMSFVNFTKYPPSLAFLLLTLGLAFLLLSWFEKIGSNKVLNAIETYGSAPMFFYLLHLYVLHAGYIILEAIFGSTQGELFGVDQFWLVWATTVAMAIVLYFPTKAFARFKHQTTQPWARYF